MQVAVSCPFAAETEVFKNLYLDLRLMVGQQHLSFPRPANNGFHSPTGQKLTHAVLIRVMV
jgi:hypothetical protein